VLIDVQAGVGLGLFTAVPIISGAQIVSMHTLEPYPTLPNRQSVHMAEGGYLVSGGEAVTKKEIDARYGNNTRTAPNAFCIVANWRATYMDCTWIKSAITYGNTAPVRETNTKIAPTMIGQTVSCALVATRDVRPGHSIVINYGRDYIRAQPAPLTYHKPFPSLCDVVSLYNFNARTKVDGCATVDDDRTTVDDWPATLVQRWVCDEVGLLAYHQEITRA
jgi:hypothetical protein